MGRKKTRGGNSAETAPERWQPAGMTGAGKVTVSMGAKDFCWVSGHLSSSLPVLPFGT